MRENFKKLEGLRKKFKGTFVRFGTKTNFKGYPETTVLLENVKCCALESINCDHIWFDYTKQFQILSLQEGDIISFEARVKEYYKGYKGYREDLQEERPVQKDFKLSHPTKITLLKRIIIPIDSAVIK